MAGTRVTATQAATASAATAEVLANSNWPSSAAAPEYSASSSATAKAARAKRKVRTGDRSELARRWAMTERLKLIARIFPGNNYDWKKVKIEMWKTNTPWCLEKIRQRLRSSQRYANGLHDVAQNRFGGFRFFLQRSVPRTGHYAVRKYRHGEFLEVIRQTIIAAIEKSARLCRALQHQRPARTHAQGQQVGISGAVYDLQCVIVQTGINFYVRHFILHGKHFADVRDRLQGIQGIFAAHADSFTQNFSFRLGRGIAHFDAHQKSIQLRFRQRIGAMMFHGVLRGNHQK